MNAPHYTTHQRTTRAASCKHTESGAPKREPFRYIYEERGTPDLQKGDAVIITDQHSAFFDKTGVVDTVLTAKKFLIKFNWGACAIHPFKRSQLAKVERKGAPSALLVIDMPVAKAKPAPKRPDRFMCEWGVYNLSMHPDIPRRFIEWKKRDLMKKHPVETLYLPAPKIAIDTQLDAKPTKNAPAPLYLSGKPIPEMTECQRIAHEKFLAFMSDCEKPRYTRAELYAHIEARLAMRQQERKTA